MARPSTTTSAADLAVRLRSLWGFEGRNRVLHMTWFAFFLTFVVWFAYAPFATTIEESLGLTSAQTKTLGLCNVALTVPARIFIGMALDWWGPRRVFGALLVFAAVPNTVFALASSFEALVASRLAVSIVGAGFVVGIRMVSEWFPPREVGTAEGVYGGWGNFGAAAAAFTLPAVAALAGGDDGWRWAIGVVGLISAVYGVVYLRSVQDTPDGVTYARPRRQGALEVTNRRAVWGLALWTIPLSGVLALIGWRIWHEDVISDAGFVAVLVGVVALLVVHEVAVFRVNRPALAEAYPPQDQYPFRTVVVLCVAYLATFGSELAVVSILPTFFEDTWGLGPAAAGIAASGFAFMNLVARPGGGLLSDVMGSRRRALTVICAGVVGGYLLLATVSASWPWMVAVAACMVCSLFVQAGAGAVCAVLPLVRKRVSGQITGMAGAYGNIGGILFLTLGLYTSTRVLFLVMAAVAAVALCLSLVMVEPANSFDVSLLSEGPGPTPIPARIPAGESSAPDGPDRAPEPVLALVD
jgi:MFS transporter, NNP family, nitrate/nitrite transporter